MFYGASALGQVLYGIVTGTITDATGAAVPNTTVTVRNQNTGDVRTTTTSGTGEYTLRDLLPGTYTITVAATGNFAAFKQENVPVEVNTERRVNASLQAAGVTSEVTVTTAPPALQTETAEVNHQISAAQVENLPITSTQGRNFQALYTIIPGAAAVQEQNSTASNPSRAESANFNGVEDMGNTTRIDGAVNTYGWLPYLVAYLPPADSIQTVNITTNSFNAEQGVAGGASVNVIIKSGTNSLHGSAWEYNQLFNTNARPYTTTTGRLPKNIFNQFGFSIGGPVVIPHVINGHNKLFFFQAFERTTRRQLITNTVTVPDANMLGGNFTEVQGGLSNLASNALLYDPQAPGVALTATNSVAGYLLPQYRPTFLSEYGSNSIPVSRQSPAAMKMLALLQPISSAVGTPSSALLSQQLQNDYLGSGTLAYNRNTSDSKVNWQISDKSNLFGRYSVEPFQVTDPQNLGAAGGGTFDGGQPGAAHGRIQNVGLGFSHVLSPSLVLDADGGYTRQNTGAQSSLDIQDGDFGTGTLGIPGTNGVGPEYVGQPTFAFCALSTNNANCFTALGNSTGGNPFLFRDNQFTGDINLSWTTGKHATRYGFTYYHFDLNHFQPTSGANITSVRGGFQFLGGMTTGPLDKASATDTVGDNTNAYTALADFLLGLPNDNQSAAVAKATQLSNPNSLRWTELAGYAQDQWTITPKLTLNYGIRYEYYPAPYRDHTGVFRLDPTLPQSGNVEIGGVNGNPENAGINAGWGLIVPRVGIAYRLTDRTVIRTGGGLTEDPDSLRFLRDSYPEDNIPQYVGSQNDTIAQDSNGNAITLATGIPAVQFPNLASGFVSLPVTGSTNTTPANYRRGYIESWNLFLEQDLGNRFIANVGYVGTHQVRQLAGYTLNSAPLPDGTTTCMANGQFNPNSRYFIHPLGSNPCNFAANEGVNLGAPCPPTVTGTALGTCYNTGGITMNQPVFSSNYNGLQAQLTRNAGNVAQFGLVYTWSHAFDYEDNGAGSGSNGVSFSYPGYFKLNRATASYNRDNNLQFWFIYHLPFGRDQLFLHSGLGSAILGGLHLNGQVSHISGGPFSITPAVTNGFNSPGNTLYANQIAAYQQLGGHARTVPSASGVGSPVSGGAAWFNAASFTNVNEPTLGLATTALPSQIPAAIFGNTHRNQFTGPGVTGINASVFRDFHVWRETQFQVRVEGFNILNHPQLTTNPNSQVGGGTFGYITSFGSTRTLQYSGRFNF